MSFQESSQLKPLNIKFNHFSSSLKTTKEVGCDQKNNENKIPKS